MTAVEVVGLGFRYREREVLHGVDLTVRPGEVVSIVGANGAGKTTLLKAVAGLHRPSAGRIVVAGRDVTGLSRREAARLLAFVPQAQHSAFPMTVFDAVLLGRRPYLGWRPAARDLETVAGALDRLGLSPLAMRTLGQLSGGERQKVSIARAVAQQSPVLLLDEPTTYLDLRHQLTVLDIARSLAADGVAVLMTIHDLNLAFRVSDRIVAIHDGRVAGDGPPQTVTAELVRAVYGVEAEITEAAGQRVLVPRAEALGPAATGPTTTTGRTR